MDVNQIIGEAINAGGGMLDGKGWFVLEGQVKENCFRIKPMEQFYTDNIMHFKYGRSEGYVMLGIFASREAAEEHILFIRSTARDESGNAIK